MSLQFLWKAMRDVKVTSRGFGIWCIKEMLRKCHSPFQSPSLNPIGNLWSMLKRHLNKYYWEICIYLKLFVKSKV
uniref:Tc1-like transposase DDE domain-containing protein n=1 Tax=Maylandia zebra TaxID=106582 RepID=A0A3P9BGK5_9CICH